MKVKSLLGLCLMSVAVCITPINDIVQATDTSDSSKNAVEEATDSEKKVEINDDVLNENEQATVVTGADGLLYVVAADDDADKLITPDEALENNSLLKKAEDKEAELESGVVDVTVDEKRQEKADAMDTGVKDFDDVDFNKVEDLQSALNDDDFPFLEDDEAKDALAKSKSTNESDEIIQQTKYYFAEQILEQTQNFNDVPMVAKSMALAVAASRSGTVKEERISPPSGYTYVLYMVLKSGYDYTENYFIRRTINGEPAFCIEPGVNSTTKYTTSGTSPLTATQRTNISAIISAYKYDGGWSGGTTDATNVGRILAAQILIWQNTSNNPKSITVTPNYNSATNSAKTRITNIANKLKSAPTYDKTSATVNKGDKATFTVKSNNYKLSIASASNGGSASISGNTVTVNTSGVTPGNTVTVTVRKGATSSESTGNGTAVWTNGSYQKLVTGLYFTNTTLTVKVKDTGTVEVKKVDKDTNAALSGATFRFTYNGTSKDVVTNSNGIANLGVQLNPGTVVKVKETKAPSGYKLDGTEFSMTVSEGKTVSTTRTNVKETGTLKIVKTGDLDGKPLSGVTFSIFKSDDTTAYKTGLKTDADGTITVAGVPFGDYYVKETAGVAGYEPDGKSYKVTVSAASTDAKPATVTISNTYNVSVTKTVSDKNESNKTSNAWSAAADEFLQYDLTASKLEKSGTNNVTSFVLTDNVDMTKVDISKVQVFTGTTDVTSSFDIAKTDTGVVTAKAKAASLTTESFYDKVYVLRTTMTLKTSVKNATTKEAFTITKGGSVSVGSTTTKSANSNNVTTTLGVATLSESHILANTSESGYTAIDTLKSSTTKYYIGEPYSYAKLADGKKTVDGKLYYYQFSTAGGTASYSGAVTGDVAFKFYYVPFTMPAPTKNVYDSGSSTKLTTNTINVGDTFTYQVQHLVSANFKSIKLTEYSLSDTIDSRLTIVSKKIKNASGTDVTSQFDDKTSGNTVKYVAKAASLKTDSFYGVQYTLEIQVKVNTTKIPMGSTTKATQVITNEATMSYDNTPLTTNKTTTTLPAFTITDSHMLSKNQLANSVITTMKKNSNKYYRGESYKVAKMSDGKFTYNNVVYYYNFVAALGEASYAGTVTKDQAFNFYYSGVTLDDPAKSVTDKDESNASSNTIEYNETFTYKVTHEVPSELATSMMTSYVMTDAVDSKLSIVSKRVLDNTGNDVTSSFTDKTSGNNIRYEATATALKTAAFYGKTYTFEIKVKVATASLQTTSANKSQLTFTNKAYVIPDNVSKATNTVTSILPVYTITANHTLLKTTTKSDTIGLMKTSTDKYYRGEAYKYDKMADGKITLSNVLYYYNFITTLGNTSYSGNASKNETFNFYYVSILVKDPTKTVTDSDEKTVTNNTILSTETFAYNVKHEVPKQLATANFSSYVMTDTIDSKLTIVSKRILDSSGKDVTSLFSDKTSGNNVRYEATATALKTASFYGQTYTYEIKVKAASSALETDQSKRTQLTFSNKATVIPDNVSKTSNTVTSILPVYTLKANHTLLKSTDKTATIGSMKQISEKYYRGDSYKYDKMADGKITLNNTLYYYNFISGLGNASYSGTVTKDDTFNFYYLSVVVSSPTKSITDKDESNVSNNTILVDETYTYNVKHAVPKELATANFDTYVMTDTIDSKLSIVSKRVVDASGKDVTSLFSDKTSGNNVRYEATATALKSASFYGQTYTYEIKVKVATSALITDKSKKTQLTFTNKAAVIPDNVSKVTNTVTSILPVYTINVNHTLLKTAKTTDMIGSMKTVSEKYYRGEAYKYDKMADGRITLSNVLYYYNFIPSLGNASYSGTVLKDDTFNFYYLSIVVNTPDKKVTDSDQTNVTSNTITAYETYTYNVRHVIQQELATAQFGTYYISDTIDSKLTVVSTRVLNASGKDVTSLFDKKTSGNTVRYDAKAASLKDASFYGTTYDLEIKVKVSDATLNANGATKRTLTINNVANVTPDGVVKNTPKVETTLPAYKVTINHIDVKTKAQLAQDIDYKYDGEKYTYNPRTDLYDDEHNNYKSFVVHTGTINGKDIVLETPYHIPVFTVNIEKIQIDTAKASASTPLPVVVTMSDYREYEDELGKIVYRVKAVDTDNKNKVVYTKDFKVADYTDTLKLTLPTDYLTKDKKVNYTFTVEVVANPEENDFNTESGVVKTYGFTASEKVLTNSDLKDGKIDYSAVLRTVKERKVTAVKEFKEHVHYDFVTEEKSKTGYGFELAIEPAYENELNNSANIKMTVVSPKALVDDYINAEYVASGSNIVIPMDKADATTKSESGVRKQTYEYEMPHVNVERGTGALFTDKQVSEGYSKIQDALVDGGNKFYLPIWADLGDYDIFMSSDSTFGQNLIKINMHKDLNIYAYMYGTIGSETINRDELVVQPVYTDESYDTQLPDDWTEAEKDWVKNN